MLVKIICSIKNVSLREQLWMKDDITLEQAIEKCKSKEQVEKQMAEIKTKSSKKSSQEIKKIQQRGRGKQIQRNRSESRNPRYNSTSQASGRNKIDCKYCGYERDNNKCSAKGKACDKCGKLDHYAKMCRSQPKTHGNSKQINTVEEQRDERFVLSITSRNSKLFTADLMFCVRSNTKSVECMMETGATCNMVGIENVRQILEDDNPKMANTNIKTQEFWEFIHRNARRNNYSMCS